MGRRALDLLSPAVPPRAWLPLALGAMMLASAPAAVHAQERARIDLDGAWQFQTDPQQRGERERWAAASATPLARTIQVPGAWQAQGIGEPAGILRHHYAGDAWYRRTVAVPADMDVIRAFYADKAGFTPSRRTEPRLREESV